MTLQTFDGFPAVNRGFRRYLAHAEAAIEAGGDNKMTQDTFDRLEKLADSPSPVDATVNAAELMYARRNELDSTGRGFAYGLFTFATQQGFHGLRDDNRGQRIADSLARDDGAEPMAGQQWPAADTDPGAKREYLAENAPAPTPQPVVEEPAPPATDAPVAEATTNDSGNNGPPPPPPSVGGE